MSPNTDLPPPPLSPPLSLPPPISPPLSVLLSLSSSVSPPLSLPLCLSSSVSPPSCLSSSSLQRKQVELGDKMDLSSYLLKPVQRMSKYALLLTDLMKEVGVAQEAELVALQAATNMVKFQLRHGNDLLAMDAIRDCDVSLLTLNEKDKVCHGLNETSFLLSSLLPSLLPLSLHPPPPSFPSSSSPLYSFSPSSR